MPDPIRWGILGTGAIARKFALDLHRVPDARLEAVGSRDPERARAFAGSVGAKRAHGSYADLVRDRDVDVVYVASPNAQHREHSLLALEHGRPVLCEKPFALDAREGREVVALARARRLFCMEAMWMRCAPLFRRLDACLGPEGIGDVRMVVAHLGWPIEVDPSRALFDPARGGGALLDLGVYPLSFASRFLGRPRRVSASAVFGRTGVDEQDAILLEYEGGRQALLSASLSSQLSNDAFVVGSQGMIHVHAPSYFPHSFSLVRSGSAGPRRRAPNRIAARVLGPFVRRARSALARARSRTVTCRPIGTGYAHEAIEVGRCLRAGEIESPLVPLDESVSILETLDEIRREWKREP